MIKYETGKRFPYEKYLNRGEICVAIPNQNFFDVLCCISSPTSEEIKQFKTGRLTVSLFEKSNVPFLIFNMGFNFDVSLDATKVDKNWMSNEANTVNMYLVDATTSILKALRIVSLPSDFCGKIRSIISEQLKSEINVEHEIAKIMNAYTTEMMIQKAIMKYTFR